MGDLAIGYDGDLELSGKNDIRMCDDTRFEPIIQGIIRVVSTHSGQWKTLVFRPYANLQDYAGMVVDPTLVALIENACRNAIIQSRVVISSLLDVKGFIIDNNTIGLRILVNMLSTKIIVGIKLDFETFTPLISIRIDENRALQ